MAGDITPNKAAGAARAAQALDIKALQSAHGPQAGRTIDPKIFDLFARLPDYIQHVLMDKNGVEKTVPNSQLKNIPLLAKDNQQMTANIANYFNRNTINRLSKLGPEQIHKISLNKVLNGEDPLKEIASPSGAAPSKAAEKTESPASTQEVSAAEEVESVKPFTALHAHIEHALLELPGPNGDFRYAKIFISGFDPKTGVQIG